MPTDERSTASSYLGVLSRRAWIIVLVVLIVVWLGTAYTFRQQKVYRSAAVLVVVLPLDSVNASSVQQATLAVSAQLKDRTLAGALVSDLKPSTSASALLSHLQVIAKPDSAALELTYDDTDPARGTAILDRLAQRFVIETHKRRIDQLQASSASRVTQSPAASADGATGRPTSSPRASASLNTKPLPSALVPDVELADPAYVVGKVEPKPVRNIALAGILGILLGVMAAFAREQFDDTIRGVGEAEAAFGIAASATLPQRFVGRRPFETGKHGRRVDPVLAELAGQRLAANLASTPDVQESRSILITSAQPEEGKSTVTASLAVELASSGKRVIVVEADLRRPMLHEYLSVEASANTVGLDAILRNRATATSAIVNIPMWSRSDTSPNGSRRAGHEDRDDKGQLQAILASPGHTWPAEIGTERVLEVLNALKSRADYVIFDAPPALVVPDAYALISSVDMVIAVVRSGKSTTAATVAMARLLQRLQPRQVQLVVTEAPTAFEHSYYHTYAAVRPGRGRQEVRSPKQEQTPS